MLLRSRAKALRIDASADKVQERIGLREQNPQLRTVNDKILQDQIADDFRRQRLLAREVDTKVRVGEEEIAKLCKVQTVELRQIELAQILLRGEEIPERITIIREQFEKGMAFEEMARLCLTILPLRETAEGWVNFERVNYYPQLRKWLSSWKWEIE